MQSALGDAAKQDGTQGVVAIAKKAQDLYKQQQEIQKKADQRYGSRLDRLAGSAVQSTSQGPLSCWQTQGVLVQCCKLVPNWQYWLLVIDGTAIIFDHASLVLLPIDMHAAH